MCIGHPFAKQLAGMRRVKNLSQKKVALDAGLDQSYLAGVERGRRPPPRLEILERLCAALGATENERRSLRRSAALTRLARDLDDDRAFICALLRYAEKLETRRMNCSGGDNESTDVHEFIAGMNE